MVELNELKRLVAAPHDDLADKLAPSVWISFHGPALIAELEALRRDKERLDWLVGALSDRELEAIGVRVYNVSDFRAAIDAAMEDPHA